MRNDNVRFWIESINLRGWPKKTKTKNELAVAVKGPVGVALKLHCNFRQLSRVLLALPRGPSSFWGCPTVWIGEGQVMESAACR
jgi:hypothetical protein